MLFEPFKVYVKQFFFVCRVVDDNVEDIRSDEFLQYDFTTIEVATDFFSDVNKLGQGGFGAVYKVHYVIDGLMKRLI